MKSILAVAFAALAALPAIAGPMLGDGKAMGKATVAEEPPRLLLNTSSAFVFESDFEDGDDASGDSWQNEISLAYRIPLGSGWPNLDAGGWYLRLGARYARFDFSNSGGLPIPNHLQSISGIVALEYLVGNGVALLMESRPGVYFENDISSDAFDAPTILAAAYRFNDRFTGIAGATFGLLREYPAIPAVGFIWNVNDRWTVSALYPQPRVTYKASGQLDFYVGGDFAGDAYRVDRAEGRPGRLDGAVVSYREYRAGLGMTYKTGHYTFEVGGGYAFQREFDFHRTGDEFKTDEGAPYVKVEVKAAF